MSEYDFLKIFESIIDEGEVSGKEEELQKKIAPKIANHKATKSKKKNNLNQKEENFEEDDLDLKSSEEKNSDNFQDKEKKSIKPSSKFEDFIKAANEFRATKSLSSPDVKNDLEEYFNGLSKPEKQSLHVFFKGITQIAGSSDVPGDSVPSPFDYDEIKKSDNSNVSIDNKKEDQEKEEETSSNPIKVESLQEKSSILSLLNEINN